MPVLKGNRVAYLLVVDDDRVSRRVLCRLLARAGHECAAAPNGGEAVGLILARTPDLIVLDLFMPDGDGLTLLEVVRSYLRLPRLPVVLLTAAPDCPQARRATKVMGVGAVLTKGAASIADILGTINGELATA